MGSKCSIMMKSPTGGFCVFRTSQDANPVSLRFNDTLTLTPGGQLEISDMGAHIVRKVLDYTLNEDRYLISDHLHLYVIPWGLWQAHQRHMPNHQLHNPVHEDSQFPAHMTVRRISHI